MRKVTTPPDYDALLVQYIDLQEALRQANDQIATLQATNYELVGKLDLATTTTGQEQVVISDVTRRHGAALNRLTRLRNILEGPPKPFAQMTKAEILQFVHDFYDKITTPIPDDPNQDTI